MEKIVLSQGTEVEINGLVLKVYAPTFDRFVTLQEKITGFEKIENIKEQMEAAIDILYDILKPNNESLTKEDIKSKLTMEAFTKIIQLTFGTK